MSRELRLTPHVRRLEMTPQLCLVDLGYNASAESNGNDASVMSSELRLTPHVRRIEMTP